MAQQDSTFSASDVHAWGQVFGWSDEDAASDLDLAIVQTDPPTVAVADASAQSKRNRNRAKAILLLGSS